MCCRVCEWNVIYERLIVLAYSTRRHYNARRRTGFQIRRVRSRSWRERISWPFETMSLAPCEGILAHELSLSRELAVHNIWTNYWEHVLAKCWKELVRSWTTHPYISASQTALELHWLNVAVGLVEQDLLVLSDHEWPTVCIQVLLHSWTVCNGNVCKTSVCLRRKCFVKCPDVSVV